MNKLIPIFILLFACTACGDKEPISEGRFDSISHYLVFEPEPGIHCISVKRGFGSSVDCWKSISP